MLEKGLQMMQEGHEDGFFKVTKVAQVYKTALDI